MKITAEQLSQAQAAHTELRAALHLVQNAGLDGNAVLVDQAAHDDAAQRVLWPLLDRLWPFFHDLVPLVAELAAAELAHAVEVFNEFLGDDLDGLGEQTAGTVRQLRTNAETVETFMRQGWQGSEFAGMAMEQTLRWACGLGGCPPPPPRPGPPPLSHFPPA